MDIDGKRGGWMDEAGDRPSVSSRTAATEGAFICQLPCLPGGCVFCLLGHEATEAKGGAPPSGTGDTTRVGRKRKAIPMAARLGCDLLVCVCVCVCV